MAFPKKLLNSYETVRLDLRPHWWYLAPPVSSVVGAIIFGIFALSNGNNALKWVALGILVACALWLFGRYLKWISTNFVITTDRLIFRQGVIAKQGVQIPLERVNNVNFHQTIFERMIGAGDLLVESGGEDGQQRFTDIKHPDKVTNLIHEAMEGNDGRSRGASAFAAPAAPDVGSQLEKLEGLLQRGSITPEEFEAQKRKLLG